MRKPWRLSMALLLGAAWSLLGAAESRADLIVNGGFETGDFTGWTLAGNTSDPTTFGVDNSSPHSGAYAAYFGPQGMPITLSQDVATDPGASYILSFSLKNEDGSSPNEFAVSFGGVTLADQSNLPAFDYKPYSIPVSATAATTTLTFSFRNDFAYFDIDDISLVRAVPEPGALASLAVGSALAGGYALRRRRRGGRSRASA